MWRLPRHSPLPLGGHGMTQGGSRTPPGADLYGRDGDIYLVHREGRREQSGFAVYDPNTGYFTCRTCGFEEAGESYSWPCHHPGCTGTFRFDGTSTLVCRADPSHRYTFEQQR